jgi:hypothetical protein
LWRRAARTGTRLGRLRRRPAGERLRPREKRAHVDELGDLLLDLRDVVLELVKLLLEVLAVLLGIIEFFADLFNLSILNFDQRSQLVQFLIDFVTLAVKLVDLRLEFQ